MLRLMIGEAPFRCSSTWGPCTCICPIAEQCPCMLLLVSILGCSLSPSQYLPCNFHPITKWQPMVVQPAGFTSNINIMGVGCLRSIKRQKIIIIWEAIMDFIMYYSFIAGQKHISLFDTVFYTMNFCWQYCEIPIHLDYSAKRSTWTIPTGNVS